MTPAEFFYTRLSAPVRTAIEEAQEEGCERPSIASKWRLAESLAERIGRDVPAPTGRGALDQSLLAMWADSHRAELQTERQVRLAVHHQFESNAELITARLQHVNFSSPETCKEWASFFSLHLTFAQIHDGGDTPVWATLEQLAVPRVGGSVDVEVEAQALIRLVADVAVEDREATAEELATRATLGEVNTSFDGMDFASDEPGVSRALDLARNLRASRYSGIRVLPYGPTEIDGHEGNGLDLRDTAVRVALRTDRHRFYQLMVHAALGSIDLEARQPGLHWGNRVAGSFTETPWEAAVELLDEPARQARLEANMARVGQAGSLY